MIKKILVPVDFSEASENALQVAAQIARLHNLQIVVVHIVNVGEFQLTARQPSGHDSIFEFEYTKRQFELFLDKDYLQGIQVQPVAKGSLDFSRLGEVANECDAGLIIMETHGSTGISDALLGSHTEQVIRSASCPVLTLKNGTKSIQMRHAIFACDFKLENLGVYMKAMDLFRTLDLTVEQIYVNQAAERFKSTTQINATIRKFASKLNEGYALAPEDVVRYSDYTAEKGILNYARHANADIIAIPTQGKSWLSHLFEGSLSESLANNANLPVITFKIQ
ncbi:MAG: universal stress protein [Leeuwenhoekiella sp.]